MEQGCKFHASRFKSPVHQLPFAGCPVQSVVQYCFDVTSCADARAHRHTFSLPQRDHPMRVQEKLEQTVHGFSGGATGLLCSQLHRIWQKLQIKIIYRVQNYMETYKNCINTCILHRNFELVSQLYTPTSTLRHYILTRAYQYDSSLSRKWFHCLNLSATSYQFY